MEDQIRVAFVGRREVLSSIIADDKFHVRPVGWLQNFLWKTLGRLGAVKPVVERHIKYVEHVLDTQDILREIGQQLCYVRGETRSQPLRIIMGRDKFTQLVGTAYDAQMNYGVILAEESEKVMGMEITIVPWMSGMVVLP